MGFLRRHFNLVNSLLALIIGLAGIVISLLPDAEQSASAKILITTNLKISLQELDEISKISDPAARLSALEAFETANALLLLELSGGYFEPLKLGISGVKEQALAEVEQARLADERRLVLEKQAADTAARQAEADRLALEQQHLKLAAEAEAASRAEMERQLELQLARERVCQNDACTRYINR